MSTTQIKCPHCGESIDVSGVLRHQLEEQIREEHQQELAEDNKKLKEAQYVLKQQEQALLEREETLIETIGNEVNQKLAKEKVRLESGLRQQLENEKSEEVSSYLNQITILTEAVKEKNKLNADYLQLKTEKELLESTIRVQAEEDLNSRLKVERATIQTETEKQYELKFSEQNLLMEQMKEQMKDMQRRAEQGSMQRQGEVQELAIEEFLSHEFPLDTIEEVKKGDRGADSLQIVNTRTKANCGSIYYESKRTKEFKVSWLAKFKADMRSRGAMFGMLVTDAMPKGVDRMTQMEGIWVCSFEEFKALCHVLRQWVITISEIRIAQVSKGDKMNLLYDFLTGPEFRGYMEAIVESFVQMKSDLESEKRSMQNIWKKRERQIEKVQTNTIDMHAAIKAIAGSAIGTIKLLELTEGAETEEMSIGVGE